MLRYALLLLGFSALGQSRPDLSGTWTRVEAVPERGSVAAVGDGAFRVGSLGSGWGTPLTLHLDGGRLVVDYQFFSAYDLQAPIHFVYALDGSESRNAVTLGHSESVLRSRAQWRDSALVITTTYPVPGRAETVEVRQALTLESPVSMVIETTRTGVGGAAPAVTRTTWTRR